MFLGKAAKLDFALWELKRSHGIVTELKECHPNVFPNVLNGAVSFLELLILSLWILTLQFIHNSVRYEESL